MAEYREISDDEAETFLEIVNYAFRLHEGPLGSDADEHLYPSFGERRGLYVDDDLRCVCRHYFLDTKIRGGWYEMGGLTVVASPPEHRRQGYVSELTTESLEEYRSRDIHVSTLWPFDYDFYRSFGWGMANEFVSYECPPRALDFAADSASGSFRRLSPDEYRDLEPILEAHGEPYELSMRRPEGWWAGRTFARHGRDRYVYGWERDGELRGYLAYTVEEVEPVDDRDHGETQLQVHDWAWVDQEAYVNLLRFLFNHDSQVDSVRLYGSADLRLFDLVSDPESVDCHVHPGAMVRLVNVPEAIEMLEYPTNAAGRFVLAVSDEHAECNDGTFAVTVEDGIATCVPTDERPDVELSVARLSQLYVGARSLADLERTNQATVSNPDVIDVLDEAFPESDVYLREYF
ncbi:GNAT family N-acetyltransferase [Haladaptatus sp. NG-WS-4]